MPMQPSRTLRLRKETLTELTPADLRGVAGGSYTTSFESCPTWWCTPVVTAIARAATEVVTETTVAGC